MTGIINTSWQFETTTQLDGLLSIDMVDFKFICSSYRMLFVLESFFYWHVQNKWGKFKLRNSCYHWPCVMIWGDDCDVTWWHNFYYRSFCNVLVVSEWKMEQTSVNLGRWLIDVMSKHNLKMSEFMLTAYSH